MKKIKSSFIAKLFLSLISIYIIVFIILFLSQGLIFRSIYTNRTIKSTISKSIDLFETTSENDITENVVIFAQETQTQAILVPLDQLNSNIGNLSLQLITVEENGSEYSVNAPILRNFTYESGQLVSANLLYHEDSDSYVPIAMNVDGVMVIMPRHGEINSIYRDLIPGINSFDTTQINGTLISVDEVIGDAPQTINPLISNEILNIATENYTDASNFSDSGFYYFTENEDTDVSHLVFFNIDKIDDKDFVLIAIYPMSHIDDIISAIRTVNIYTFSVVVLLLLLSSFFASKQFSNPLVRINNTTKELSNLNFDIPLINIETQDEFSELAKNINLLSVNLKTALDKLNVQNKQLSRQIDLENENEELRKTFLQGMSHELKTPLAIIQASAEAVEKNVYSNEVERKMTLQSIQNEVTKTNKLISNMLEVYKLDTASYKQKWLNFDLTEVIQESINTLSLLSKNKNQTIAFDESPVFVTADSDKIKLVIGNLVTNAIKYSPRNQEINISVKEQGDLVIFTITNTGVEIDEGNINNIFDPFYRLDKARSRKEGSTGLGLYIVQQILNQHNSSCEVVSENNSVTFSFTLKK